jgi:hypothetical protein
MRRISSKATFWYKWIFPLIWFGFLAVFAAVGLSAGSGNNRPFPIFVLIVPFMMAVVGYFVMKKLVLDLVDEVWDDGAALIVRNKGREDRVALSNIINVSYSPLVNPPRVTLTLRQPSNYFGTEINFSAPIRFIPFAKSELIEELIRRIDAARRK